MSMSPFVLNGFSIKRQIAEISSRLSFPFRRRLNFEQMLFFKHLMTSPRAMDGSHLLVKLKDPDLVIVGNHLDCLPAGMTVTDQTKLVTRLVALGALNMSTARSALNIAFERADPQTFQAVIDEALRVTLPRSIRHQIEESFLLIAACTLRPQIAEIFTNAMKQHPELLESACLRHSLLNCMYPRPFIVLVHARGNTLSSETLHKFAKIYKGEAVANLCETSHHQNLRRHRLSEEVGPAPILSMSIADFEAALPDLSFTQGV